MTSFKERPPRILETTVNELYFVQTYGYSLPFDLTNNTRLKQRPAQLQLKTNFGYNIIKIDHMPLEPECGLIIEVSLKLKKYCSVIGIREEK